MLYEIALESFKGNLTFRDVSNMVGEGDAARVLSLVGVFLLIYENNKHRPYYDIRSLFLDFLGDASIEDFEEIYNAYIEVYGDE